MLDMTDLQNEKLKKIEKYNIENSLEMQKYELKQSSKSPKVVLDHESGEMFLGGRSIPDNALDLFGPMLDWAAKYVENPQKITKIVFNFEYYNTASSKSILEFLLIMNELQKNIVK